MNLLRRLIKVRDRIVYARFSDDEVELEIESVWSFPEAIFSL